MLAMGRDRTHAPRAFGGRDPCRVFHSNGSAALEARPRHCLDSMRPHQIECAETGEDFEQVSAASRRVLLVLQHEANGSVRLFQEAKRHREFQEHGAGSVRISRQDAQKHAEESPVCGCIIPALQSGREKCARAQPEASSLCFQSGEGNEPPEHGGDSARRRPRRVGQTDQR